MSLNSNDSIIRWWERVTSTKDGPLSSDLCDDDVYDGNSDGDYVVVVSPLNCHLGMIVSRAAFSQAYCESRSWHLHQVKGGVVVAIKQMGGYRIYGVWICLPLPYFQYFSPNRIYLSGLRGLVAVVLQHNSHWSSLKDPLKSASSFSLSLSSFYLLMPHQSFQVCGLTTTRVEEGEFWWQMK